MAAKARDAARKSLLRVRALFRIGLYHLQVVASILMSIKWMPDVPPFLIGILNAVRSVLTLDVPGLMSSPACASTGSDGGAPMSPLAKWYLSLFFPLAICALFPLWYACASSSQAKIALKEAGVQVVWVWLFATIVTACLKILDCTTGSKPKLILDPTLPCPLDYPRGDPTPAIVGIGVFVLYVGPLLYHLVTVPFRKFANWFKKTSNRRAWGWVVDDYADEEQAGRWSFFTRSWELFTTLNKLAMLAGSATMYPKNRFFVSSVSMWYFSVVQLMARPYTNRTNNILAIAFSVCDILGVYAAYPETSTTEIQIAFLVMTLVMVIITVALLLRSTCHKVYRLRDLDEQKKFASFSAEIAAYSRRERCF